MVNTRRLYHWVSSYIQVPYFVLLLELDVEFGAEGVKLLIGWLLQKPLCFRCNMWRSSYLTNNSVKPYIYSRIGISHAKPNTGSSVLVRSVTYWQVATHANCTTAHGPLHEHSHYASIVSSRNISLSALRLQFNALSIFLPLNNSTFIRKLSI